MKLRHALLAAALAAASTFAHAQAEVKHIQAAKSFIATGVWAGDTAQQFGALVAALMAPAVLSVYAVVAWSLAANLGWTDTFVFKSGPLSNWMVWMGAAVLVSLAASILRKHSRTEAV